MATPVAKLEFCQQPLSTSNAAATWIDVTRYCKSMTWSSGVAREFDDPQAGSATFVLKSLQRRFEPDYAAGAYYPNIVPGRRFRVSVDGVTQGIYYAQSWDVGYPDRGNTYSEVVVTCTDGFWRLALDRLGAFTPPVDTYADLIKGDNPIAYYPLNDPYGITVKAEVGGDGIYVGTVDHITGNPVVGSNEPTASFTFPPPSPQSSYARLPLPQNDETLWFTTNRVTIEAVTLNPTSDAFIAGGPFQAAGATQVIFLHTRGATAFVNVGGSSVTVTAVVGSDPASGRHHQAATWDGLNLKYYLDGVLTATGTRSGNIDTGTAGSFLYIGGDNHGNQNSTFPISHVAFYADTLTPARIQAHADAAINLGLASALSGSRIATLATDSLWSTAGIPTGTITAAAITYTGQSTLDEITNTAKIEQPGSLFYFDDSGNPDYRALMDTQTIAATFGDAAGEVGYDAIQLVYNDEVYNSSTVAGEGLDGATRSNTTSQSDYGVRAQDATGLIITSNSDAALIAQTIVDRFGSPQFRVDSITLNGANPQTRTQILNREIGDTIRIRRRGDGGTPIDIVTRILGKEKSLTVDGDLRCTWTLARGFNASTATWHLGVASFDELNTAAVLG